MLPQVVGMRDVFGLEMGMGHPTAALCQTTALQRASWPEPDTLQGAQLAWLNAVDGQPPFSSIIILTAVMWHFYRFGLKIRWHIGRGQETKKEWQG